MKLHDVVLPDVDSPAGHRIGTKGTAQRVAEAERHYHAWVDMNTMKVLDTVTVLGKPPLDSIHPKAADAVRAFRNNVAEMEQAELLRRQQVASMAGSLAIPKTIGEVLTLLDRAYDRGFSDGARHFASYEILGREIKELQQETAEIVGSIQDKLAARADLTSYFCLHGQPVCGQIETQ